MPEIQTFVSIPDFPLRIGYNDTTCFFGSCFSNNVGKRFLDLKFNALTNPFGVLYNPASIAQSIDRIIENQPFSEQDIHFYNGLWYSLSHYTSFSNIHKEVCLEKINTNLTEAEKKFKNASVFFITLGTSYVFRLKETGNIVANCHKLPAGKFSHEFLNPDESVSLLSKTIQKLDQLSPNIHIVLTISPIRHWKDGAIENQRSKAALILAARELEKKFKNVYYFPVYEIFMDELRDYRYYASDMLHPSDFAIDYVWEKFVACFFNDETKKTMKQVEKLNKSLQHRPINVESEQHQLFLKKLKEQILLFSKINPQIDFAKELSEL